jgi:hypothetical protein
VSFAFPTPGEVSLLEYGGLSYTIGAKAGQSGGVSALGAALASHPALSTAAAGIVLYLQLFSLVAVARPRLHRIWGVGLIGFHLGALFGMEVPFLQTIPLLAVLWIGSPFAKTGPVAAAFAELPIVRLSLNLLARVRTALQEIGYGFADRRSA